MGSKKARPAARLGDIGSNHGKFPPTPIIQGSPNVFINGRPAARKGDSLLLHAAPKSKPHTRTIAEGSTSVLINGRPAARTTDAVDCGGTIISGSGNVHIGDNPQFRKLLADDELQEFETKTFRALRLRDERIAQNQREFDRIEKGLKDARAAILESRTSEMPFGRVTPDQDDAAILAQAQAGLDNTRILVSLQPAGKGHEEPIGFPRPDTGRCTMWLTTYEQLRAADLSPEHIAAMLGMDYDPEQQYELYIYDQGEDAAENGATCFIPTYERMAEAGVVEFKDRFDEQLLRDVMTEECSIEYAKAMEAFWETGGDQFHERHIQDFAASHFATADDGKAFLARHYYRSQIGCNTDFLGNGATRWKEIAIPQDDGSVLRQPPPQQYGVVELVVIEKNPPSIEKLKASGHLRILPTEAIPPYIPPTGA